jgi:hypothetical protein
MVIAYDRTAILRSVAEIEKVLRSPNEPGQLHRVAMLARGIAKSIPSGAIANLAMQVLNAVNSLERFPLAPEYLGALDKGLRQLRAAVEGGEDKPPAG